MYFELLKNRTTILEMIYIDKKHIHKANCRVQFMNRVQMIA